MKTVFGFLLVSVLALGAQAQTAQKPAVETPKSIACWGVNADGAAINFTFGADTLIQNEEVRTSGMPPYPTSEVERWKLGSVVVDRTKLEVSGYTTGFTTGQAGRITVSGTQSGASLDYGLDRVFYRAHAEVLPASRRVVPRVAIPYDLNCETRW